MCLPVPKRRHSHKHKSRPSGNVIELQNMSQSSGTKPMHHGGKKKSKGHSRKGSSSNHKKHKSQSSRDKGPGGATEEERGHPMRMLPSPELIDRSSDEERDEEGGEGDIAVEVMRFTMPARAGAAGSA